VLFKGDKRKHTATVEVMFTDGTVAQLKRVNAISATKKSFSMVCQLKSQENSSTAPLFFLYLAKVLTGAPPCLKHANTSTKINWNDSKASDRFRNLWVFHRQRLCLYSI